MVPGVLDFRKAYDLIDHNKPLSAFSRTGIRPALIGWFGWYLHGRTQMVTVGEEQSQNRISQGSALGPPSFKIKINQLSQTASYSGDVINLEKEETIMFMDDKTVSEVIGIVNHEDGQLIGNTQVAQQNIDNILEFAHPGAKNANKLGEM